MHVAKSFVWTVLNNLFAEEQFEWFDWSDSRFIEVKFSFIH